jgi:hypothetical protein
MKCRTFCRGPDLKVRHVMSLGQYMDLFRRLNEEFGQLYYFRPTTTDAGGISMTRFPGWLATSFGAKGLVHQFPPLTALNHERCSRWEWQFHVDKVIPFYVRALNDVYFLAEGAEATTLLSTSGDAPPWTIDEVKLLARCLEKSGFTVGPLPPVRALSHDAARVTIVNFQGKASWE